MALYSRILKIQGSKDAILQYTEAQVKLAAIVSILSELGWDITEPREVDPDYNGQVDYALRLHGKNRVFVRVRKSDNTLTSIKKDDDILEFCKREQVGIVIFTNGVVWRFYATPKSGESYLSAGTIDISAEAADEVVRRFEQLLSRSRIEDGTALEAAQRAAENGRIRIKVENNLSKAWNKLFEESCYEMRLAELLNEALESIIGCKGEQDQVLSFIDKHEAKFKFQDQIRPEGVRSVPVTTRTRNSGTYISGPLDDYTNKVIRGFRFLDEEYMVSHFVDMMRILCKILAEKHYSVFKQLVDSGKTSPYFTRDPRELIRPEKIERMDVYFEKNLDANRMIKTIYRLLSLFGYAEADLVVDVR